MANTNAPFGGRPVKYRSGAPYNGACNLYYYAGGGAVTLYTGDPVVVDGDSNSAQYNGNPPGSLPTITIATAGRSSYVTGFIVGFYPELATSNTYCAAAETRGVWVADDPELIFEIQDSGAAASTTGWPSGTFNLDLSTNSGSTATGYSGCTLNTTQDNNAAAQMRVLRLAKRTNNAVGAYAVWEACINYHSFTRGVAGV